MRQNTANVIDASLQTRICITLTNGQNPRKIRARSATSEPGMFGPGSNLATCRLPSTHAVHMRIFSW